MGLAISGRQRDLLYGPVIERLTGIDEVWRAIEDRRWEDAQRLGQEFADLLQLVVEGLGWGEESGEAVHLEGQPASIRRALKAIKCRAGFETEDQLDQRLLVAQTQIDRSDTLVTCDELAARLEA